MIKPNFTAFKKTLISLFLWYIIHTDTQLHVIQTDRQMDKHVILHCDGTHILQAYKKYCRIITDISFYKTLYCQTSYHTWENFLEKQKGESYWHGKIWKTCSSQLQIRQFFPLPKFFHVRCLTHNEKLHIYIHLFML